MAEYVGVDESNIPSWMILIPQEDGDIKKYKGDSPSSVADIATFVDGVLSGDIQPYVKSEEPPAE